MLFNSPCSLSRDIPLAVANVAFRSAKAASFRGAKGDIGSAILNRARYILHAVRNDALRYQPERISVRLGPPAMQEPGANALRLIPRSQPRAVSLLVSMPRTLFAVEPNADVFKTSARSVMV